MIRGSVNSSKEAVVSVSVQGNQKTVEVSAILDTGFTGHLTLPNRVIENLELLQLGTRKAILADGSFKNLEVYKGRLVWDDLERDIVVLAAEGSSLLGMSLLYGFRVTVEVLDGGEVTIAAIQ